MYKSKSSKDQRWFISIATFPKPIKHIYKQYHSGILIRKNIVNKLYIFIVISNFRITIALPIAINIE